MMILLGHTIIFSVALLSTTISADGADDEAQYEKAQKRFISTLVEKMDEIYDKSLPQRQKLMIKFMEDAVKGEGKGREGKEETRILQWLTCSEHRPRTKKYTWSTFRTSTHWDWSKWILLKVHMGLGYI